MNKRIEERINTFLQQEFNSITGDMAILYNDDGSYELFNKYKITKKDKNLFEIKGLYSDIIYKFSSLKSAVSWCVYEKRNKWAISNRIFEIEQKISGLDVSMSIHKKMIHSAKDNESKLISLTKLNEEKLKRKSMIEELTKYIHDSKFLQFKAFENRAIENKKINTL